MLKLNSTPDSVQKDDHTPFALVQKVIGGDTYTVMAQSQIQLEDEFSNLYFTTQDQTKLFLQPPFEPTGLLNMVTTNNTLLQCVEAMEVNVDGTGFDFVAKDGVEKVDEAEVKKLKSLFNEPYPGQSFTSIRRKLRKELESVGYAYLEILRNMAGDIVGFRNINSHNVRMVKLDAPVLVERTVERDGKEVTLSLWERERRFAQRIAMKTLVYYKEFGVKRNVNRSTGAWIDEKKEKIEPKDMGTELLMIGLHPDVKSPYFVPRWVNQFPSVIGSRKAEEQNLEFFDSGGMPPAIIFIQGGTLASDAADQLKNYLSGKNKNKYRAVVVEAQSSSGSMDASSSVQVKVERFGGEKANDALYQEYDKNAEDRVRMGFRMPPLFLGKSADYNFATAMTAYMTAEAQVFKPARTLFDDLINSTILRAMGIKTARIKSNPITLQDVANQITALGLVKDNIEVDSLIETVNKITGMDLEAKEPPPPGTPVGPGMVMGPAGHPVEAPQKPPTELEKAQVEALRGRVGGTPGEVKSAPGGVKTPGTPPPRPGKKTAMELIDLSRAYAGYLGVLTTKSEMTAVEKSVLLDEVNHLDDADAAAFNNMLSTYLSGSADVDLVSLLPSCGHQH